MVVTKQRKRKRQRQQVQAQQEAYWKPVSIEFRPKRHEINYTNSVDDEEDVENNLDVNHYDDPKLQRTANDDLPAQPGEDIAMFYGLEVLDSSQYELAVDKSQNEGRQEEQQQRFIVRPISHVQRNDQESTASAEKKDSKDNEANKDLSYEHRNKGDSLQKQTKKKNKDKKKKKTAEERAESAEGSCQDKSLEELPEGVEAGSTMSLSESSSPSPGQKEVISEIQTNWSRATGGAILHERLCAAMAPLGFKHPTPIQSATLSAAVLGRRNLVGAAPTGSGKTLAFLLPILQFLLEQQQNDDNDEEEETKESRKLLQALILTPTRELALQIQSESEKLLPKQCVALVGGIALAKQKRLLQSQPRIIVATPGRLWAMLSSGENQHLHDLSQIRFLVLDEADRMVQKHCFPQLVQILDAVHVANPGKEGNGQAGREIFDEESDEDNEDFLSSLPGVRGETKVAMLTDDILKGIMAQKKSEDAKPMEAPEDENELEENVEMEDYGHDELDSEEELEDTSEKNTKHVHRQTFIYSATLTLPHTATKSKSNKAIPSKKAKHGNGKLDGAIAEILEKTNAMGDTKIVDLSSTSNMTIQHPSGVATKLGAVSLPPGLHLEQIKCTQRHKDSHLYAYLVTTARGSSGPCLIFCNSIACVRRVGVTLQKLGLPVRTLHAHMQQKARFKAVESLQDRKSRAIVVSTDVAARGLNIPSVATVVHYDVARAVDTFVHRSGRTARGMGEDAVGSSLSLVAPSEDKAHKTIADSMQLTFENVAIDGRLLAAAQERTNLACKVVQAEELQHKTQSSNKWFLEKAAEADLEVDDDLIEDDNNRPQNEVVQLKEAERAKARLAQLLAQPMKTQRYGKFLSSYSAAKHSEVKPYVAPDMQKQAKKPWTISS